MKSFKFPSSGSFLRAGLVFYLQNWKKKFTGINRGKYSASHVVTAKYDGQYITVFISGLVQLPLCKKGKVFSIMYLCKLIQKIGTSNQITWLVIKLRMFPFKLSEHVKDYGFLVIKETNDKMSQ